jgi:ATP-binding cassette subfamily C (CFTR/MRP) protein 4
LFVIQYCFQVLGVVGLVGWINYWSVLSFIGLVFIRVRYAPSSRALKRLEGITRSPVYAHVASTINGLKVIRAYSAENVCTNDFYLRLDDNTRVNHLIIETNRWAGFRFDWVALVFIGLVTLLAVTLRVIGYRLFSSIEIALILSNSLSLMALLQFTIR